MSAPGGSAPPRVVCVGASAGGLRALQTLVGHLPQGFALPVVVVQHRSRDSHLLCELLQEQTVLGVEEVTDKGALEPGRVYVAPPDYHTLVEEGGSFSLSVDEPVRFSRPSIDVTFDSVADAYGAGAVGVVLTGANADGSWGLSRIAERGGRAVVQDPATAEVPVMPRMARAAVPAARVLPLDQIAPHLARLASEAGSPRGGEAG